MLNVYSSPPYVESTESIYPTLDIQNNTSLFISHELRTPLTSIQGILGLLHSGQLGELSEEGHRLLTIALNNTQRLTRLACAIERENTAALTLLSPIEIEQLQLENELCQAFIRHQLRLVYQPIVQVAPRKITSFEVLIRWHHPVKGEIPPSQFIPMAERSGIGINWAVGIGTGLSSVSEMAATVSRAIATVRKCELICRATAAT